MLAISTWWTCVFLFKKVKYAMVLFKKNGLNLNTRSSKLLKIIGPLFGLI